MLIVQGYNFIYDRGYAASDAVWVEKQKKVEEFRTEQINQIQGFAKTNLEETLKNQEKNAKDLRTIYNVSKGKQLTSVDCTPTTDFSETYNAVIIRSNKK